MLLSRRTSRGTADESGSALIVVIGVMAVGLILTAVAMNSVVYGLGYSTATRAGVQSQAAAEAGVAAARAGLFPDASTHLTTCSSQPISGRYVSTTPVYTAIVEHYDAGPNWLAGCPTSSTTQVKVTSTGTAQASGVAGQTTGNTSTVEAVFGWIVPSVDPSGVGMYLYGGGTVEANSALDLSESGGAGLMIKNGNFDCTNNNTVINGSIVVYGNLSFPHDCSVNGSAWITGSAELGSGSIAHDLSAASVSPNPPGSRVGGTYTQGGAVPAIPQWAEVGYTPSDWINGTATPAAPFEVRPLTGSGCTLPNGTLGGTILGAPVILDARGCVGGPTANNNTTVRLTSDVVIFAERFDWDSINSFVFASNTSTDHRIWFITPDYTPLGNTPTCDGSPPHSQGDFAVKNGFTIGLQVKAFLYTPCAFVGLNGFTWRGQVYTGKYSEIKNNPAFTFVPVGVAGVDFNDGLPAPPPLYQTLGAVISIRDLSGP